MARFRNALAWCDISSVRSTRISIRSPRDRTASIDLTMTSLVAASSAWAALIASCGGFSSYCRCRTGCSQDPHRILCSRSSERLTMRAAISFSNELRPYATESAISFALNEAVNWSGCLLCQLRALESFLGCLTHLAMQFCEERERDPPSRRVFSDNERCHVVLLLVVDEDLICGVGQLAVVWWDLGEDRLAGCVERTVSSQHLAAATSVCKSRSAPLLYCPELLSHSARIVSSRATRACNRLIACRRSVGCGGSAL